MPKSPYKYSWVPVYASVAIGLLGTIIYFIHSLSYETGTASITVADMFISCVFTIVSTTLGFYIRYIARRLLHTQVKNGMAPSQLQKFNYYYLNGETMVMYEGQEDYTDLYMFSLNTKEDGRIYRKFFPGQVREYISEKKER